MEKKHIYWFAGVTTVVVLIVVMLGIAYNRGVFYAFLERNSTTSNSVQITTVMEQYWKGMNDGSYQEVSSTLSSECIKVDGALLGLAVSASKSFNLPPQIIKKISVTVKGNTAQAEVTFSDGTNQTAVLIRESGLWKINVPNASSN